MMPAWTAASAPHALVATASVGTCAGAASRRRAGASVVTPSGSDCAPCKLGGGAPSPRPARRLPSKSAKDGAEPGPSASNASAGSLAGCCWGCCSGGGGGSSGGGWPARCAKPGEAPRPRDPRLAASGDSPPPGVRGAPAYVPPRCTGKSARGIDGGPAAPGCTTAAAAAVDCDDTGTSVPCGVMTISTGPSGPMTMTGMPAPTATYVAATEGATPGVGTASKRRCGLATTPGAAASASGAAAGAFGLDLAGGGAAR